MLNITFIEKSLIILLLINQGMMLEFQFKPW